MTRSMTQTAWTASGHGPAGVSAAVLSSRVIHGLVALALLFSTGCRSDLSQQLLERELRMQEDQIYQLQDELYDKCARLDRTAGENTSLRRQLGFTDGEAGPRGGRSPTPANGPAMPVLRGGPAAGTQPMFIPPPLNVPPPHGAPGSPPAGRVPMPSAAPAPPGAIGPPTLENVPPLPAEPRFSGGGLPGQAGVAPTATMGGSGGLSPLSLPATTAVDPDARPIDPTTTPSAGRRLSHEESLADAGKITHLVINPARTECFDGDGDGVSEGMAIVVEPRDDDERLVNAAGDMSISVFDGTASPEVTGTPTAHWNIPAAEAASHFRRTSRNRGLHFVLRWPGPPPQGNHVRVYVSLTTFEGGSFQAEATMPTMPTMPNKATMTSKATRRNGSAADGQQ